MTTLDMINIASRYPQAGDCRLDLLSSTGGGINLAATVRVETQAMPDSLAHYAALILPGFFAEDVASLTQQLQTIWQPGIARLRTLRPDTLVAASCYAPSCWPKAACSMVAAPPPPGGCSRLSGNATRASIWTPTAYEPRD